MCLVELAWQHRVEPMSMTTAKQSCTDIFRRNVRWHQQNVKCLVELADHSKSIIEWHLRTLAQQHTGIRSGVWRSFLHSIRHSSLPFYLTFLSDIISDILSSILSDFFLAVEVRRGPQCSESRRVKVRRGPQRSDSRRLRSGEAHCDQELAVEVRRGPPRARAGRWGLARPTATAIKSWQRRSGEAHCGRELADEVRRGRGGERKEEEAAGRLT